MSFFRFNSETGSCQGAKSFASSFCPAETQSHNAKFNIHMLSDVVSASVFVLIALVMGLFALNLIAVLLSCLIPAVFLITGNKQNHKVFSLATE